MVALVMLPEVSSPRHNFGSVATPKTKKDLGFGGRPLFFVGGVVESAVTSGSGFLRCLASLRAPEVICVSAKGCASS